MCPLNRWKPRFERRKVGTRFTVLFPMDRSVLNNYKELHEFIKNYMSFNKKVSTGQWLIHPFCSDSLSLPGFKLIN